MTSSSLHKQLHPRLSLLFVVSIFCHKFGMFPFFPLKLRFGHMSRAKAFFFCYPCFDQIEVLPYFCMLFCLHKEFIYRQQRCRLAEFSTSGKSFMKMQLSSFPSRDSCGTPLVTFSSLDLKFSTLLYCFFSVSWSKELPR